MRRFPLPAVHPLLFLAAALLLAACSGGGGCGNGPPAPVAPEAPELAPVPPSTLERTLRLLGYVEPDARVVVRRGYASWSAAPAGDRGAFELELPLDVGPNELQVAAVRDGLESAPVPVTVQCAQGASLAVAAVEPSEVPEGGRITISGDGFAETRNGVYVSFRGTGFFSLGITLSVNSDRIEAAVPPFLVAAPETVWVSVADVWGRVSEEHPITVTPAADPTPEEHGNETAALLGALRTQAASVRSVAEAVLAPRIPADQWQRVEENFRRIETFLLGVEGEVQLAPADGGELGDPAALDAVFAGAAFQEVLRLLEEAQAGLDALGRRASRTAADPAEALCDVALVLEAVDRVAGILEDARDVLLGIEIGAGLCCLVGVQPCCFALAAAEVARRVLGVVVEALHAVGDLLHATVPTDPSNWAVSLVGPYEGVGPSFLYTDTTGALSLRADFATRGLENPASTIGEVAGWILDLLGVEIPSYVETEVTVPSTVVRRDPQSAVVTVRAEGAPANAHYLDAGPAPGLTELDIQATCGPFHYPDRTECLDPGADSCREWDTGRYPRYHELEVLEAPELHSAGNWYLDRGVWVVEGKGFSTDWLTFDVYWNQQPVNMPPCNVPPTSFEWCRSDKPGWLEVAVDDPVEGERRSGELFVCPPLDVEPTLAVVTDEAYVGDSFYVAGNQFTPLSADDHVLFHDADGGPGGVVHPEASWVANSTLLDLVRVRVPEGLYGYEDHSFTVSAELAGHDCPLSPRPDPDPFDLLYAPSVARLDEAFTAYAGPGGMVRSAAVGDFDGDGIADLAVGVPEEAGSGFLPWGAVYVSFGPLDGVTVRDGILSTTLLDLADEADWDVKITGDTAAVAGGNSRRIGNALLAADLDGDGVDDLVVGSTDQRLNGDHLPESPVVPTPGHVPGAAYLFYGRPRAGWAAEYSLASGGYDARLGGDIWREVGHALAAGDLNGDGRPDLVVTAPSDSWDPDVPNALVARAYVVFGTGERLAGDLSLPELSVLHGAVIEGENAYQRRITDFGAGTTIQYKGDGLGKAVAVGDVTGDGTDDLVLGAPEYARTPGGSELSVRHGAVYLFQGGAGLSGTLHAGTLPASDRDLSIEGPRVFAGQTPTGFGKAVAVVDLDGDGRGELVVGAPDEDLDLEPDVSALITPALQPDAHIRRPGLGCLYLVDGQRLGATGDAAAEALADVLIHGAISTGRLGYALAAGDADGDGAPDLLAGAPGAPDGSRTPGRVWGLRGGRAFWRETDAQDHLHLETRKWLYGEIDPNPGFPLADAVDDFVYIGGSRKVHVDVPAFGTFVAAAPLVPGAGAAVLVADPSADGRPSPRNPGEEPRTRSGVLHAFFGSPEETPWPLTVSPAAAAIRPCDERLTFWVYGGGEPYRFNWNACYQTWLGDPPFQTPGPVVCQRGLPEPFAVEYGPREVVLTLGGCAPTDLVSLGMAVSSGAETASASVQLVAPAVAVDPTALDFRIQPGSSVTDTVQVTNQGNADLAIVGATLTGSPDFYLWDPADACGATLAPGVSCSVGVGFSRIDEGTSTGVLALTTDDPDEPVVEIPLTGTAAVPQEPDIRVIGLNLVFGGVPIGSTRTQEATVRNEGAVDLHVTGVAVSGAPEFALALNGCTDPVPPYTGSTSQLCKILVSFTPSGIDPVWGQLEIRSDDPDQPVLTGDLSGAGIEPFVLVSPTSLDLGETDTEATFTIENQSPAETLAWSVTGSPPAWLTVTPGGGSVAPGETETEIVTVTVDRTGLAPGTHDYPLNLTSDGGDETVAVHLAVPAPPEPLATFAKTYGGASDDEASSIRATPDGGFLVAGRTKNFGAGDTDAWVLKLDASGRVEWERTYGGADDDRAYTAIPTADGGYAVVGGTWSWFTPGDDWYGLWVWRLDAAGDVVWQRVYGGHIDDYDDQWEILETPGGGFVVAGMNSAADDQGWVLGLDATGAVVWDARVGGADSEALYSADLAPDGGTVSAGVTWSTGQGSADALVVKLDAAGAVQWQKTFGGAGTDYGWAVRAASAGGYVVAGFTESFGPGTRNLWVLRLDAAGGVTWQRAYGMPGGFAEGTGVEPLPDGGFLVAGWLDDGANGGDAWLLHLDPDGAIVWSRTYGGTDYERAWSAAATPDGDYAAAGLAESPAGPWDAWVLRVDAVGNLGGACGIAHYADATAVETSAPATDAGLPADAVGPAPAPTAATVFDSAAEVTAQCTETVAEAARREPVDLDVTPAAWDFGPVPLFTPVGQPFTVRNTGYQGLDLLGLALEPPLADFSVSDDCPATLAPTHRCQATVTFTPSAEGPQATALTIDSNDPDESSLALPIDGAGGAGGGEEGPGGGPIPLR